MIKQTNIKTSLNFKKICGFFAGVAMALLLTYLNIGQVQAEEIIVTKKPAADTTVYSGKPTYSNQSSTAIWVGHTNWKYDDGAVYKAERSLLKFDLSDLPRGSQIKSANLNLYSGWATPNDTPMSITPRLILGSWSEDITWNQAVNLQLDSSQDRSTIGVPSETGKWYTWNITNITQKWSDSERANSFGLILTSNDESGQHERSFRSKEYSDPASTGPKLEIKYELPAATPTPTTIQAAPKPPTKVTATCAVGSKVNISWTKSADATFYTLSRKVGDAAWNYDYKAEISKNDASFSDQTEYGTTYLYNVKAYNSTGQFSYGNQVSVNCPHPPTNLTATCGTNKVTLGWTKSAEAIAYTLSRKVGQDAWNYDYKTSIPAISSGISDDVSPGVAYSYNVKAVASSGQFTYGTQVNVNCPAVAAPTATITPTPTSAARSFTDPSFEATGECKPNHEVLISWARLPNASSYTITRRVAEGEWVDNYKTSSGTSVADQISAGYAQTYVVNAINSAGQTLGYSNVVAMNCSTYSAEPAFKANAVCKSKTEVLVSWDGTADATYYTLSKKIGTGAWNWDYKLNISKDSKTVTDQVTAGTNSYYVNAIRPYGGQTVYNSNLVSINCDSWTPGPTAIPSQGRFMEMCVGISAVPTSPKYGDIVTLTCANVTGATDYSFRYSFVGVDTPNSGGPFVLDKIIGQNNQATLHIEHTGTYTVECRPCSGGSCPAAW